MKNKFLKLGAFLLATVALASCMKDKNFDNGTDGIEFDAAQQKVVSLEINSADTSNLLVTSFDANPNVSVFNLAPVQLAGGVAATQDVHVVLALDTQIVHNANQAFILANPGLPAPYVIPTAGTFTTSSLTVTIPKGQSRATLTLSLIPSNFLGAIYGIGVKIVSVDGGYQIAANYKRQGIFAFGIKNAYDGIYSVISGNVTRYTSPGVPAGDALSGPLGPNNSIVLTTSGTYSDVLTGELWANGQGVAGIDGLTVTVNPADNSVTMSSQMNGTLTNWAGHVNSYDPSTRTFHLSFRWNPTTTTREYEVIMKWIGPRP